MAILVTGGTGKTSTRLSTVLQSANPPIPHLLASRNPKPSTPPSPPSIKFDWEDPTTYLAPFTYPFPNSEKITAVYLIAPQIPDPARWMKLFIDVAVQEGVKRFVLLTGSSDEMGAGVKGGTGAVWQYLNDLGVEYTVLRATWFMENFLELHKPSIIHSSKISSACADGRIPFVSADDIASLAYTALTSPTPIPHCRVLGPELLTHDDIAKKLSNALHREITNVKLSKEESAARYEREIQFPPARAQFMAMIESMTATGFEEREGNDVERETGKKPITFDEWVAKNVKAFE